MKQKLAIHQLRTSSRSRRKITVKNASPEYKILMIQNSFITPGLHCVNVQNHEQGRRLIQISLDSLGIYSDVGMVSMSVRGCPLQYRDIYYELSRYDALSIDNGALEDYLLSSFTCECLILEYTQELIEQPWFGRFEQLLSDYSITNTIPVMMFLYDEQTLTRN